MEKNLKEVPANKQKSLGKLPTDVRNKMGYAKKGTMMKAKKGKMTKTIHSTDHPDVKMTQKLYAKNKIYAGSKEEIAKNLDEIQNKIAKKRTKTEGSFSKGGGADMGKKDYKLGLKIQGDYKGKDLKGKAKEFISTALKQNKGSISKVLKKLAGSQVSDKEAKEIKKLLPSAAKSGKMMKAKSGKMIEANMGMEAKSTQGYGAARTSGMGLQDENLIPGKSLDYYKDVM